MVAEDRRSTHERTLRGVHWFHSSHLRFTLVLFHSLFHLICACTAYHGRVPAAGPCFSHVAHDYLFGIVVPVVPCWRRVVISGFLAGGTPGFRNVLCVFCTLPERLAVECLCPRCCFDTSKA